MKTLNKTENRQLILDDKNLPVKELLDPIRILDTVNSVFSIPIDKIYSIIKIEHIRYSPKKTCLISFTVFSEDKTNVGNFYIKCMNDEIYTRVKKEIGDSNSNNNIVFLDEPNMLVCKFPSDGKLDLFPLIESDSCISSEVIRYKPETRFVAKYGFLQYKDEKFSNVIARIELPEKVLNSYDKTLKIRNAIKEKSSLSVPAILCFSQKDSLLIQEQVEAVPFAQKLIKLKTHDIDRVANVLADLHDLNIEGLETKDTSSFINQFERSSKILNYGNDEIQRIVNDIRISLMLKLHKINSSHSVVIHGDFHQGQILLGDSKTWIIDLDSAAIGSPAADLGNFYAQLKKLELKKIINSSDDIFDLFLETYQNKTKANINKNKIEFYTGCSLVGLAVKELRRQRKNWFKKVIRILDESLKVLQS